MCVCVCMYMYNDTLRELVGSRSNEKPLLLKMTSHTKILHMRVFVYMYVHCICMYIFICTDILRVFVVHWR